MPDLNTLAVTSEEICSECGSVIEMDEIHAACPECGSMVTACNSCSNLDDDKCLQVCGECVAGSQHRERSVLFTTVKIGTEDPVKARQIEEFCSKMDVHIKTDRTTIDSALD